MLYDIRLSIRYDYQAPVAGSRHVLYMTPAQSGSQRVITSLLDVTPMPDERIAKTDFYGNTAVEVAFPGAARRDRVQAARARGAAGGGAWAGSIARS